MAAQSMSTAFQPMHPGELLREIVMPALEDAGETEATVAAKLSVTAAGLREVLNEAAPITPELANRLGRVCGNGPDLWLALQAAWDLEQPRCVGSR